MSFNSMISTLTFELMKKRAKTVQKSRPHTRWQSARPMHKLFSTLTSISYLHLIDRWQMRNWQRKKLRENVPFFRIVACAILYLFKRKNVKVVSKNTFWHDFFWILPTKMYPLLFVIDFGSQETHFNRSTLWQL